MRNLLNRSNSFEFQNRIIDEELQIPQGDDVIDDI